MEEKSLQSTSPLGAVDVMGTITTVHLILIALFAVAAVMVIVWGAKRRRAKRHALAELESEGRLQTVDSDAPAAPAETLTEPARQAPQPVERVAEPAASSPVIAPVSEAISQPVPVAPPPPPIVETPVEIIAAPVAAPEPSANAGDLTRLKGLGPKVAARLAELNVTRIADLAALNDAQAADLDAQLGNFRGRMARDKWIEQARLLDAGDIAGYEAQFGKLG
ncbi:hypothetical protein [Sphingomonas sp. AX6]|uniref:hypothetical protein n=1 Tax=Sphingomonas sp. AX6 TaxID=2653171 RepID=UPI0012F2E18D|nr:hypothetical protein [Sphingomonas sp. AX6]VXC64447.1 putative Uncharacterized 22.9 kDa protein in nqo2 3'region [Sphingomonas sp. AX6]